jgi:hypothetical protein
LIYNSLGRRTTINSCYFEAIKQQKDNSRKARDRMAAGRGGGLSATIFKEDLGAVIGDNNAS